MMIREIQPEDYAAVAGFWRDYLDIAAATDESVSRTLEKMSKDTRYFTFVAEEDGKVVGFITCVEVLSVDDPAGYIKINGIAVHPAHRNRGIGTRLIALTTSVDEKDRKTAFDAGMNAFGEKPIIVERLFGTMAPYLMNDKT